MASPLEAAESDRRTLIAVERRGGVVRLTLKNPPANALSVKVMELLLERFDSARKDKAVRVVILAAAGKLFSAGHDLKELASHRGDADRGEEFFAHTFALCSRLMQSIAELSIPVIAEVDGIATAAGCQLVAACDLAIASNQSRFGVNGIDVGLFCSTPAVQLTRNISCKRAMEMLLTGEMIDASTALEFGLVNRVVRRERLHDVVGEFARIIAGKSPVAVKLGKKAVREQSGMSLANAYEHMSRVMVENMLEDDAVEGFSAFFEKREPKWQ